MSWPSQDPADTAQRRFAPAPRLVAALGAAAVVACVALVFVDTAGRVLLTPAAAVLLVETARGLTLRPVLTADRAGVCIRTGLHLDCHPWPDVVTIRSHHSRRLVSVRTLEIDLGETLVVVPGYRLGAEPDDVAAALDKLRDGEPNR